MQDLAKGIELASRYTLVRKLGAGAAAETWLATDRLTRASVALKILIGEKVSAADFHKEWQTSIRLMHAHIVRVFEFSDDPENAFYSLQFVDGPDIGLLSGAPLEHVLPPIGLLADALRYAHGKGVVHRDIKVGNVLIDHNGAPYLIDFGVAYDGTADVGGGSLIAASPQTLAGAAPQPADDIFALGGLIYELVSGQSPYSSAATAEDIRQRIPPPLQTATGSAVPAVVQQLVAKMLDKDAAARPDAAAVVAGLEAAGFAPGAAPAVGVAGERTETDEVIQVSKSVRSATPHATAASKTTIKETPGIRPGILGAGLAILLVILIGVVFFLPDTVTTDRPEAAVVEGDESAPAELQRKSQTGVGFSENVDDLSGRDARVQDRADTEEVLGELLSKM